MPRKFRLIENEIKEIVARKAQFENELCEARSALERLQIGVVKGTADTETLVAAQSRVTAIAQTIGTFDSKLAALDADLTVHRNLEKKREISSKIKLLDEEAEKAGRRLFELFATPEELKLGCFSEIARIIASIEGLKFEFARYVAELIPNVNSLKSRHLPELENELNNLIADLKSNHCQLSVLRATGLSLQRKYVTDDDSAFSLPENAVSGWIWLSVRVAKERDEKRARRDDTENGTGE
jgi:chromosome segregation ATPase